MSIPSEATPITSDPRLAQLALDLCLDDQLAARYLATPEAVLIERGLPIVAGTPLIDDNDLLVVDEYEIPAITWCFSTPDGDRLDPVA